MAKLWEAIYGGDVELAEALVRAGANLHEHSQWDQKKPSLLHAVISWWSGDIRSEKLALLMIEHGADVNACDASGTNVLHVALTHDCSVAFVGELLNRGAKVDVISSNGFEIMMLATCKPTATVLQLLPMLIEGDFVDVITRERRCLKALYYLVNKERDYLEEMEAVLALGVPIDQLCDEGYTLLHYAVLLEKIDKIELLLRYGADINAKSKDNMYPLFVALSREKSTTTKVLIERGANIHKYNDHGVYPIHAACLSGSFQNIQLLLRLGVNANVVDNRGRTAFSMLRSVVQNYDCVMLLIKHFALLTAQDIPVHESDLNIIRTVGLQTFYEEYLRELQKAKQITIYNDTSYFSILTRSTKTLSLLMKNPEFVESYESQSHKMIALFPTYHACIQLKYKIAERRKDILLSQLSLLEKVFNKSLPNLVSEKIVYYLCEDQLSSIVQNYIFSYVK